MNPTHETATGHTIAICNKLLRGELSAVETYGQAIMKYDNLPDADQLRRMRFEHSQSAKMLTDKVRAMGGRPTPDSGVWGLFVSAVQGTANLIGEECALESLKQGEELGRQDYENALKDTDVPEEFRALIRNEFLPSVVRHIASLEAREQAA